MEKTKYAIYAFITTPEQFVRNEPLTDDEFVTLGSHEQISVKFEILKNSISSSNDYQYNIYAYMEELHNDQCKILTPNELIYQGSRENTISRFKKLTSEDVFVH